MWTVLTSPPDCREERPGLQHYAGYVELVHPESGCSAGAGMAGLQHLPDAFADYPLGDTIKEYYKTWYGYDVTDDELEEMLLY